MFCQKCGTEITDDSQKFCHKCGERLSFAGDNRSWQTGGEQNRRSRGVTSKLNEFVGWEGKLDLHLRDMVSGVLNIIRRKRPKNCLFVGQAKPRLRNQRF